MNARRIWVAGHKGMVGSAIARCLAKRGDEVLKVDRDTVDLRNQAAVQAWLRQHRPHTIVLRRRKGRRHLRQRCLPRRFHLRQSGDRGQRHHAAHLAGVDETPVPRLVLHLSEIRHAADQGGGAADRSAGTDERMVCDRQDRRDQALPGLPEATRPPLHLGDALQSLRTAATITIR